MMVAISFSLSFLLSLVYSQDFLPVFPLSYFVIPVISQSSIVPGSCSPGGGALPFALSFGAASHNAKIATHPPTLVSFIPVRFNIYIHEGGLFFLPFFFSPVLVLYPFLAQSKSNSRLNACGRFRFRFYLSPPTFYRLNVGL